VLSASPVEGVAVVTLYLQYIAFAHATFGAVARQYGAVVDLVERDGAVLEANRAGQHVALVGAVAQAGVEFAAVIKAVDVAQRGVLR